MGGGLKLPALQRYPFNTMSLVKKQYLFFGTNCSLQILGLLLAVYYPPLWETFNCCKVHILADRFNIDRKYSHILRAIGASLQVYYLYRTNGYSILPGHLQRIWEHTHDSLFVYPVDDLTIKSDRIMEMLQHPNCQVKTLLLHNIGAAGASALTNMLQSGHPKLTSLNLGFNNIGPEGAIALATALQSKHSNLTSLNLLGNAIGDTGTAAIAEALQHPNCNLIMLDLFCNAVGTAGATTLFHALLNPNCNLTTLMLTRSNIGTDIYNSINKLLQHNNKIRGLKEPATIAQLTTDRAAVLRSLANITNQNPTNTDILTFHWMWHKIHPSLRTAEIFHACYNAIPHNKELLRNIIESSLTEKKIDSNNNSSPHREELSYTETLLRSMVKSNVDDYMDTITTEYLKSMNQNLDRLFHTLEDADFRKSKQGIKVFQRWLIDRGMHGKITLEDFSKAYLWTSQHLRSHPEHTESIKNHIKPLISIFLKKNSGLDISPEDDAFIEMLKYITKRTTDDPNPSRFISKTGVNRPSVRYLDLASNSFFKRKGNAVKHNTLELPEEPTQTQGMQALLN